MTETPKNLNLDTALQRWPTVEKTAEKWEEMAQAIEQRLLSETANRTSSGLSDDNLLRAPLGQIEGEGHNSAAPVKAGATRVVKGETMTMPADRERDRRSLQDLAKMASEGMVAPPSLRAPLASPSGPSTESAKDDSGIVDLAAAVRSDPQGAVRAQSTPLASQGLFEDEVTSAPPPAVSRPVAASAAPLSTPSSPPRQPVPSLAPPVSVGPASFAATSVAAPNPPASSVASVAALESRPSLQERGEAESPKKRGFGLIVGGLLAAGAIAAGAFLFVGRQKEPEPTVNKPVAAVAPQAVVTPVEPVQAKVEPAPAPIQEEIPAAAAAQDSKTRVAAKTATAHAGAAAKAEPADKKKEAEEAAKVSAKELPTSAASPEGDLGKAMGAAVGADGKPVQPAAGANGPQFAAGSVPQKPSQGAVTGAIGAVLPNARACLGPDDPVSRASITFGSTGAVQSVSVSGGAAGKPAEGCIKAALSAAKVAPFAESSYSANVTVRH